MKKFTLLIALLVCSVGFSQSSLSSYVEQNPTRVQQRTTNQNINLDGRSATYDESIVPVQQRTIADENQELLTNRAVNNNLSIGLLSGQSNLMAADPNAPIVYGPRPEIISPVRSSNDSRMVPTTLTYNTDNIITGTNSVACGGGDNFQARYFVLADFGITSDFTVTDGEIGVQSISANEDVTVSLIAADATFPTGYPGAGTLLGSQVVTIPLGSDLSIVSYTFTTPIVVPAGTDFLIVEVFQPLTGTSFFIGGTAGETADSWLASVQCGVTEYTTTTSIGFPDAHYYITVTGDELGGGGGVCPAPMIEVNQDVEDVCMANISQTDLAQSYMAVEAESAGAGVKFTAASTGEDLTLSLWDALPNAGGVMLATGTTVTTGDVWVDVFWDPVVTVTPGNTYFITIEGTVTECVAGSVNDPYPGGNVYANAGYQSFPGFDYTFRTYSCDGGGGGGGCAPGVYADRASFQAEAGVLTFEDFAGGPGGISACGEVISSAGGPCFPAGEIQPGVEITIANPPNTTVYVEAGNFSLPFDAVGSNTFVDYTIINFPNMDVNSFAFDLFGLIGGATIDIRIFGTGGLITTETVVAGDPNGVFFGYIASETVVSVELEDLSGSTAELIAQLEFGECVAGGACVVAQYDATGLPADIDPGGTSTPDCVNMPNLYPVTVGDPGTIGVDSNIDNVTISITHTFDGDLDISLVAPSGAELLLSGGNGGSGDNFIDTVFMDGAGPLSGGAPPYTGTFEPDGGTFAVAFDGEDILGDWNLKVCDNFGGDTGTVDAFSISICRPDPPSNEECIDAFPVVCGEVVVGTTADNTDNGGFNAAPDEWYSFTGTGSPQIVTVSLCDGGTTYDSRLTVYDVCGGTEIITNDDFCGLQSQLTFLSDGTTTYYIAIEGFSAGNSGPFSMEITCVDPPPNDECPGAISMDCGDTVVGETITASFDATAPVCVTGITAPGVWYEFTDTTGLVTNYTLSMCDGGTDYDSKITVYSGDCGALVCVVDNDDSCGLQSEVSWQGDGLTSYLILVHGFGSSVGNFSMALTCAPVPPPNDMIANSIDVDEIGFPYTDPAVAMPAATTEAGTPAGCDNAGAKGVWYNFVPDADGYATAEIITPGEPSTLFSVNNGPLAGDYVAVAGDFGGAIPNNPLTEDAALVIDDGTSGDENDACDPIINGASLAGKIAVVRRGSCEFGFKALSAQNEGAIAVIVVNNQPGDPIVMGGGANGDDVTIPVVMVSDVDGEPIISELDGGGTVNVSISSNPAGLSHVSFYTAPDENAIETDLTLVDWQGNQCVPGTSAIIPTVAGQAYYVYVTNDAITDIVIDGEGLGADDNTFHGFTYYPNPTDGVLNLNSVESIDNVAIYNLLGQQVLNQDIDATSTALDVSTLAVGAYIMKVSVNGQIGTYKVIKR